jgi:hypothetical protein
MGSLLGVYDHCNVRASFQVRRRLYKWFCVMRPSKTVVGRWIRSNKNLVIAILKEFFFFAVDAITPLNDFMENNYYWFHMRKNAFDAMDAVRSHANGVIGQYMHCPPLTYDDGDPIYRQYVHDSAFYWVRRDSDFGMWRPGEGWYAGVVSKLIQYHRSNLSYCHRPIEACFLDNAVQIVREIDDEHYHDPDYSVPDEMWTEEDEIRMKKQVMEVVDIAKPIGFHKLVADFKISLDSVEKLEAAQKLYLQETSRSKVKNVLTTMAKTKYYDYFVIKTFFLWLKKKFALIFYDLPLHILKKQIESFHTMYGTLPGQELHESAGVYYACINCGELKAKVAPSGRITKSSKDRECTLAFDNISIDATNHVCYCAKRASAKTSGKKRSSSKDVVAEMMGIGPDTTKEAKKQSKDNRKRKMMEGCHQTELIKFSLLGKALRTQKYGLVIICPRCLCLTTLSRWSYKNGGGELSCGCARKTSPHVLVGKSYQKCILCGKEPDTRKKVEDRPKVAFRLIYDDVSNPAKPKLRYAAFCESHPTKWIEKWNQVLKLSTIKEAIYRQWQSHVINDEGDRIFVEVEYGGRPKKHLIREARRTVRIELVDAEGNKTVHDPRDPV